MLADTGVALGAEAGDLALEQVAVVEEDAPVHAVARRGAGEHQVARAQLGDRGDVGEDRWQVEEHVGDGLVLPDDAVVPQRDAQVGRVADERRGTRYGPVGRNVGAFLAANQSEPIALRSVRYTRTRVVMSLQIV